MIKKIIFLQISFVLLCYNFVACKAQNNNENTEKTQIDSTLIDFKKHGVNIVPAMITYSATKINIQKEITALRQRLTTIRTTPEGVMEMKKKMFEDAIINQIIPYWYGTEWSFSGHTTTPNNGQIACSYFTSTVLEHIGVKLDRFSLSQQSPINEAMTLDIDRKKMMRFEGNDIKEILKEMDKELKDGLYFVGLSENHVGFLFQQKNQLFFIHSSYQGERQVMIEAADKSNVFMAFNTFFVVPLSNNSVFLDNWWNGTFIKTHKGN